MAERGYLPSAFAARSRYGTPVVGIAMSSIGVVSMLVFSFGEIIEMLNAAYCLAELLEFAAFIKLRISQPDLERPYKCASLIQQFLQLVTAAASTWYNDAISRNSMSLMQAVWHKSQDEVKHTERCRVPLPAWALPLMLLPASALLLTVLVLPALQRQWRIGAYTLGVALLGACAYALLQLLRRLRTLSFCHNELLAREFWPPALLAAALCAFPTYLGAVLLHFSAQVPLNATCVIGVVGGGAASMGATWALAAALKRAGPMEAGNRDMQVLLTRAHARTAPTESG